MKEVYRTTGNLVADIGGSAMAGGDLGSEVEVWGGGVGHFGGRYGDLGLEEGDSGCGEGDLIGLV